MVTDASASADAAPIHVIGAGGHAKVVVDALLACGIAPDRIRVSDNNPQLAGTLLAGMRVAHPALGPGMAGAWFHVAIGNGAVRGALHRELLALGARPLAVCHPRAVRSPFASVGQAVFLAANAVVGPDAVLGDGVIVNHGAVVDHDCEVGAFSHVAPNATLAGAVRVGAQVLVGAGARLLPGVRVGDLAVVGAGAVVIKNIPPAHTAIGVPAVFIVKD